MMENNIFKVYGLWQFFLNCIIKFAQLLNGIFELIVWLRSKNPIPSQPRQLDNIIFFDMSQL